MGNNNSSNEITCRICGKDVGAKGFPIHLKTHDKEYREYIKENIQDFKHLDWQLCVNCDKVTKSYGDKIPTCSHECSAEVREEYYAGEGNPRYGVDMSEETKRKIGEKAKERLSDPTNHWNYGNEWSEEAKKKMSESHKENYRNGRVNPMKGETHDAEAIEKICTNFRETSLEVGARKVLEENKIEYEYQFFLTSEDGHAKSYNFYLPEYNTILEMDGDYWHGGPGCEEYHDDIEMTRENDKLKNEVARKNDYRIIRIWGSEFKENKEVILERLKEHISV